MADVITLGVRVTSEGVEKVKADLVSLGTTGEAAAKKVADAGAANAKRFSDAFVQSSVQSSAAVNNQASAVSQLAVKTEQAAVATRSAGASMNSLRGPLSTVTAQLLEVNPALGSLTSMLGMMTVGSTLVVGVLAGVAAIAAVYHALTEEARKAHEEQEKATQSLLDWYKAQRDGENGARLREIAATTAALKEQQTALDALNRTLVEQQNNYNAKTGLRDEAGIAATAKQIADLTVKMQTERAAITAANADMAQSAKNLTASLELQIARQNALNDAHGKSAVEIARVTAAYDAMADKQQFATGHTKEQIAEYNKLRDALAATQVESARIAEAEALQRAEMERAAKAADDLIAKLGQLAVASMKVNDANEALAKSTQDVLNAQQIKPAQIPDDPQVEAIKKQQEYMKDIRNIWREGIGKIVTDGFKSFQDFFDDVLQLFSRLMQRMQQEGKDSGLGYKLLGYGSAAIGAGITGYQVGQSIGSPGLGALGGAASGALAGAAFGPWGAAIGGVIGGLTGLIGGLKAASDAANAAAKHFNDLQQTAYDFAHPENDNDPYLAVHRQAQALRDDALATFKEMAKDQSRVDEAYKAYQYTLDQVNAGEQKRIDVLDAERKATNDANNARIQQMVEESARETQALRVQENAAAWQLLYDQGQVSRASQQAAAAEAQRIAQQQLDAQQNILQTAQDQLSAQRQTVDTLQRTVDTLKAAQSSLLIGAQSPLSPIEQYNEAKRQIDAAASAAFGGDQTAAGKVPDLINQFLQLSQSLYASTGAYGNDFTYSQSLLDRLTDQYTDQLTTQQMMLSQMERQTELLQAQLQQLQQLNGFSGGGAVTGIGAPAPDPNSFPWWARLADPSSVPFSWASSFQNVNFSSLARGTTWRQLLGQGLITQDQLQGVFGNLTDPVLDSQATVRSYPDGQAPPQPRNAAYPGNIGATSLVGTFSSMGSGISAIATNTADAKSLLKNVVNGVGALDDRLSALNQRMGAIERQNSFVDRGGGVG